MDEVQELWPPWPADTETAETAGKVNVYRCPHGHRTVTICLESGTTPFMIGCKELCCNETAQSSFYRNPRNLRPSWGWRHPTKDEYLQSDEGMRDYYAGGAMRLVKVLPHQLEHFGFRPRHG